MVRCGMVCHGVMWSGLVWLWLWFMVYGYGYGMVMVMVWCSKVWYGMKGCTCWLLGLLVRFRSGEEPDEAGWRVPRASP